MEKKKFCKLLNHGNEGVSFFVERHNELLKNPIIPILDMEDWNVEGSDLAAERLMLRQENQEQIPYLQYGGVEVKTLGKEQFLPRFGIDNLTCGTLGFPLWGSTEDLPNGWTSYTRDTHGNLKRWIEPCVEKRGARPIVLAHLLKAGEIDDHLGIMTERVFAAIVFEDVNSLLTRLYEYLLYYGLDILDWSTIPIKNRARELQIDGLFLQGNMVHVPLSILADLATITMIGDDPDMFATGRCSANIQHQRLDYLKICAGNRWIPQEKSDVGGQSDTELFNLWHRQLLFGTVHYPGLLHRDGSIMSQ